MDIFFLVLALFFLVGISPKIIDAIRGVMRMSEIRRKNEEHQEHLIQYELKKNEDYNRKVQKEKEKFEEELASSQHPTDEMLNKYYLYYILYSKLNGPNPWKFNVVSNSGSIKGSCANGPFSTSKTGLEILTLH